MSGGLGKTMRRAALLERTRRRSASEIRPVSLARSFPSTGHKSPLTLFTTRREDSAPNHVESLPPHTEVTSRCEDGATARVRSSRRLERRNNEETNLTTSTTADPFPAAARDHLFLTPSAKLHHSPAATLRVSLGSLILRQKSGRIAKLSNRPPRASVAALPEMS